MWKVRTLVAALALALSAAHPAAAAIVGFANSTTDYTIRALNASNGYTEAIIGGFASAIGPVITTDLIENALAINNADGRLRLEHSSKANSQGGFFGFDRRVTLALGPFVDLENDYDSLSIDLSGNPYDSEFEATVAGMLQLSWSFINTGGGTGLSIYVDTPHGGFTFGSGAGTLELPVFAGDTISVRAENALSRSAPYDATTLGFFGFSFAGAAVPEPAAWALFIVGFGMTGAAVRRSRHTRIGSKRAGTAV